VGWFVSFGVGIDDEFQHSVAQFENAYKSAIPVIVASGEQTNSVGSCDYFDPLKFAAAFEYVFQEDVGFGSICHWLVVSIGNC
jgi:hypothetical protein